MIQSVVTKTCSNCGLAKPASDYYRHPTTHDKLDRKCKECRKSATRKWKAENPERARETDRRWREQNRERSNAHYRKWRSGNREQMTEIRRRWNEANRERRHETCVRWIEGNRERLREWRRMRWAKAHAGETYSAAEWQALLETYGHQCLACGIKAHETPQGFLTPDHVVPVCMSGSNTIDNIQPLCLDCNRRKNGRVNDYRPDWAR